MSTGLAASTVTPGNKAPEASRTVPVREAWANTVAGSRRTTSIARDFSAVRIQSVFPFHVVGRNGGRGPACRARSPTHTTRHVAYSGGEEYAPRKQKVKDSVLI